MSKLSSIFALTLSALISLSPILTVAAEEADEAADEVSEQPAQADSPVASPWPVQVTDNGRTFLIYQPQVDKWENNRLEGRSAVSVRNDAGGQQNFGVVYFSARTELDQGGRTVTVRDATVSKADFPAVSGGADDFVSVLRAQFATQSWQIAQDRLQSDMEIDRLARRSAQQPLNNDPPRIVYSDRPAVLVPIDGNPVLRPVADTGLMRVANTRALILQDKASARYFLFVSDRWMQAQGLEGPWSEAADPPAQLEQAKQLATQQDQVDLLEADAGENPAAPAVLSVFVSTTPAELLQTEGPAQYAPIQGTQLLYVTNSPNKVFLDLRTQNHYALISGRWYRTGALAQGQWAFVPAAGLPADFALIPADHPTETVRAAVPGTPQAREAVIANSIPQVATVARSAASLQVAYDGDPVFQPIEGTPLQNAINSPVPVIRVSEESFYALDNGVWFVASSPFGPWAVTSYVPPVVYSIPRSSPLYYVTYVRVYDSTPEVVYVGYTPGYVGSYVSNDNVVVYGTGWPYRPWIGSVWYGAPVTWGFGFSFVYSWWRPYPWHSWHRAAWAPPPPCFRPWWGPWHGPGFGHRHFVAAGGHGVRPVGGPRWHNVGHIYDRWDRRSVVWNGPRAIANQQRPGMQPNARPRPGNAFVAAPDHRWHRLGDDGDRGRGRRDAQQPRANFANRPAAQMPREDRAVPAVQTPWRRPQVVDGDDRARPHSPASGGIDRRQADNRPLPARERALDQRRGSDGAPRARVDGPSVVDRSRANFRQDRPAQPVPRIQTPQPLPPVAGVPVERTPSQRALPQTRNFPPPQGRIERPAINPGRVERPVANPGRIVERPAINAGRPAMNSGRVERPAVNGGRIERPVAAAPGRNMGGGAQPQFRAGEGRGHSNSGGGRGGSGGGDRSR